MSFWNWLRGTPPEVGSLWRSRGTGTLHIIRDVGGDGWVHYALYTPPGKIRQPTNLCSRRQFHLVFTRSHIDRLQADTEWMDRRHYHEQR